MLLLGLREGARRRRALALRRRQCTSSLANSKISIALCILYEECGAKFHCDGRTFNVSCVHNRESRHKDVLQLPNWGQKDRRCNRDLLRSCLQSPLTSRSPGRRKPTVQPTHHQQTARGLRSLSDPNGARRMGFVQQEEPTRLRRSDDS